jgi:hypothetical protein
LPRLTIGMLVTANFFQVMGIEPELGRAFRADEDQVPGRDAVVMLSHDLWRRQFAGDPAIPGRTVPLDVVRMVVRQGLVLAVTGLGVGLLASAAATRALAAVFPGGAGGDGRTDLVTFPVVALAVLAVTLLTPLVVVAGAAAAQRLHLAPLTFGLQPLFFCGTLRLGRSPRLGALGGVLQQRDQAGARGLAVLRLRPVLPAVDQQHVVAGHAAAGQRHQSLFHVSR